MKNRWLHPKSRVSDLVGPKWGPRVCLSNEFSGDAEAADPGPHFENHRLGASDEKGQSQLKGNDREDTRGTAM